MKYHFRLLLLIPFLNTCFFITKAQDLPKSLPDIKYHLTSSNWSPLNTSVDSYLDAAEGMVRTMYQFQNTEGAIIDPYLNKEHQYTTPYYAFSVGALIHTGRAKDLINSGVIAMEKSLTDFSKGNEFIPEKHGEFYIAALAGAMEFYEPHVDAKRFEVWKKKVSTPIEKIWKGKSIGLNNWRTYAMKGEWIRANRGFIDRQKTIDFIEDNWKNATQYERIGLDKWNLYQDWSSDPQSLAVEAVGRGNLTSVVLEGYDGPSAQQMLDIMRKGGKTSMLLMSPTGQCPANGRTDNHVFNDILYQLIFEALAEDAVAQNNTYLAGQYRRSAMLAFQSIQRWKRNDDKWDGSFYITKNKYEPGERVGYQPASQWGHYTGAMMFHLAEAALARKTNVKEVPAPTEIGGYTIQSDDRFSTFTANAGGMQVVINLRGASVPKYNKYWTPLGGIRFSKSNWDDRLGPSDGEANFIDDTFSQSPMGIKESFGTVFPYSALTFGPAWIEKGNWIRLADKALTFRGNVVTEFVHPLLVKFRVTYATITGHSGPVFHQEFIITPDGVMTYLSSPQDVPFGLTVPLLTNDGTELETKISGGIASTGYPGSGDTQNFIGLNQDAVVAQDGDAIRSTYGDLLPVKFQSADKKQMVFIFPKSKPDPKAQEVKSSFTLTENGFSSVLGKVEGTMYIGRNSAGGFGDSLDLNEDGKPDLTFNKECGFIAQLKNGKIISVETDTTVDMTFNGKRYVTKPYVPIFKL